MNQNKETKTTYIIDKIKSKGHYVEEKANGHIRVLNVDFWCTTEKWYDAKYQIKGTGLMAFILHLDFLSQTNKITDDELETLQYDVNKLFETCYVDKMSKVDLQQIKNILSKYT